jgi:EmrB/QacA subfamily drug resistance transporter
MVVLDTTSVAVALPSVMMDLSLSGTGLTWILNAYTLTFAGFLLLSGRLADLYGPRRLFLGGIGVFVLASLACGLARSETVLLSARAVQGVGGALVTAASLSLISNLFPAKTARARALGIYGLVCAAGGSLGELLGGFLSTILNWHWIFLINLPIGVIVYAAGIAVLPADPPRRDAARLDLAGAVMITAAMTSVVYTLSKIGGSGESWAPAELSACAAALFLLLFIGIEMRVREPLVPLKRLGRWNLAMANLLGLLWAAGDVAWLVICALYLQRVLGYDPLHVGLAFLPSTVLMALLSGGLSAKAVIRFGISAPLSAGLFLVALGLAVFARAPVAGTFILDVLPGMILVGVGTGIAYTPLLVAAMNGIDSNDSGLASGMLNSSFMIGSALGLASLASVADGRTATLTHSGAPPLAALNEGYHCAFVLATMLTGAAAVGALALRRRTVARRVSIDAQC